MRPKEDYSRYVAVALLLTVAVLVSFQAYIFREPGRIAADEERDLSFAVSEGEVLFSENCAMCHGQDGEGVDAPALNDKRLLSRTADETIFSLINSGVPSTEMPAWNQLHGGPFTDDQVRQLVAFIRQWEKDAPDRQAEAMAGDPVDGLILYNSTCIVCHGAEGVGADAAPALNDPEKLAQFDDEWYLDTILDGRPAQGMPTWGTVMSPEQARNLVALLRAWERGDTVDLPSAEEMLAEAAHALDHGDMHGLEDALNAAFTGASGEAAAAIDRALKSLEMNDLTAVESAIQEAQSLLGVDMGEEHDDGGEHDEAPTPPADAEHNDGDEHGG